MNSCARLNQYGTARDDEELELGVRCMAAGILDDQGKLVAGLSISAPADRLDIFHAALFNGISSHVFDFDDTHLKTIIHPAGPVASAILALAEHRGPGHRDRPDGRAFRLLDRPAHAGADRAGPGVDRRRVASAREPRPPGNT